MARKHQLGDLQLLIMQVLWDREEATVVEVREALQPQRDLAPTTVATMLRKMEEKGVVAHRAVGRQFHYQPTVAQEGVNRTMVDGLLARLFDGDAKALLSHLVHEGEIDLAELEDIREMIERRATGGSS